MRQKSESKKGHRKTFGQDKWCIKDSADAHQLLALWFHSLSLSLEVHSLCQLSRWLSWYSGIRVHETRIHSHLHMDSKNNNRIDTVKARDEKNAPTVTCWWKRDEYNKEHLTCILSSSSSSLCNVLQTFTWSATSHAISSLSQITVDAIFPSCARHHLRSHYLSCLLSSSLLLPLSRAEMMMMMKKQRLFLSPPLPLSLYRMCLFSLNSIA